MPAQNHNMMSKSMLSGLKTHLLEWDRHIFLAKDAPRMSQSQVFRVLLLLIWLVGLVDAAPTAAAIPDPVVQGQLVWSSQQAHPGDQPILAIILDIHEGYHINPDPSRLEDPFLIPTQLVVTETTPGLVAHGAHFPPPQSVVVGPIDQERQTPGYEDRVVLYVPFAIDHTMQRGSKMEWISEEKAKKDAKGKEPKKEVKKVTKGKKK